MAQLDEMQGRFEPALIHIEKYVQLAADPTPGFFLRGRIHAARHQGPQAEEWLKRAAESDPENPEIWAVLGRVYSDVFGVLRTDDSIAAYGKALAIQPDHPAAAYGLGRALLRAGRNEEAAARLTSALERAPEPGPIHYDLAVALKNLGRTTESEKHLAKHREFQQFSAEYEKLSADVKRKPRDPAARIRLADFCLANKQPQAAAESMQRALREIPESARLFFPKLAAAYETMGREDLATSARDEAYRTGNSRAR
jgi:predicted Zn-dependent protease